MTSDELLAEVRRHYEHWAEHLGLTPNWWVNYEMSKEAGINLQVYWGDSNASQSGYRRITIQVGTGVLKALNKGAPNWSLSKCVLHEALHVFLDPLEDKVFKLLPDSSQFNREFRPIAEGVIDELASVIWRLHESSSCPYT